MKEEEKERMLELLSDQAIFGLSDDEIAELAELEKSFPDFQDDSPELTAATIGIMNLDTSEPLPAHLRTKILADADNFFVARKQTVSQVEKSEELQATFDFEPQKSIWNWLGWAVAAAACVALAFNIYTTRFGSDNISGVKPTPTVTPKKELTLAEQREQLLASAKDLVKTNWTDFDPKQPKNVQGEVVWSNSAQKGFVTFRGLPVNDKTKETYQLWIFDKDRKNPVSAGVFDVTETGEIIVSLDASLKIQEPQMFGVTAEKPGGDMIPNLKSVMAVAKVSV
jgi:hypothetical protein